MPITILLLPDNN